MALTRADIEFASGILPVLRGVVESLGGFEDARCQPIADLGPPLGKFDADAGLCYRSATSGFNTLVIVEREASAPGNERSLLKWYAALKNRSRISLCGSATRYEMTPDRVLLLMCFARSNPSGWSESEVLKTAEFCGILGDTLSRDLLAGGVRFDVRVDTRLYPVTDWQTCGRDFGSTCCQWL